MIRRLLAFIAALAFAAPVAADNFVYSDALGNMVVLPCTVSNGVCTPTVATSPSGVDQEVVGNVANDAVDSGNPVKIGGYASSNVPSAVSSGDRIQAWLSLIGAQVVTQITSTASVGADDANQASTQNTSGNNVTVPIGSASYAFDGTNWDRVRLAGSTLGLLIENGPYLLGRATADAQIKNSAGFIHTVSIAPLTATPTAGLVTVYCSTTESGTVAYAEWVFATTVGHSLELDTPCSLGIYVGFDGTLANVQVTVSYR